MTSAQVVETSVTNNSSFQNYSHPDDHTIRTTDTPGFKPFTKEMLIAMKICNIEVLQLSVKSDQAISVVFVLVFLRFENGGVV